MSDKLFTGAKVIDYNLWNAQHSMPSVNILSMIEGVLAASDIDGFVNPVVFGSLLWLQIAATLKPEISRELDSIMENDGVFVALDRIQNGGIIDELLSKHEEEIAYIFNLADLWYSEYVKFIPTFAGQLGKMSFLTEDSIRESIEGVQKILADGDAEKVMKIAEAWGMNNGLDEEEASE